MRDFGRTLASIVLSAPLLGCGLTNKLCPDPNDDIFLIDSADPDLQPLVAECEQNRTCQPLCEALFMRKYGYSDDESFETCELVVDERGTTVHETTLPKCTGRRPASYRLSAAAERRGGGMARYLALQTELEAASVQAFGDVFADLVELDAPAALGRATIRAAADEIRHARACDRLARRYGLAPTLRHVRPAARRSLRTFAIDNTIEGCVRETYGAVVAGYQARSAADPVVRRVMHRIARDEAKHAALAWRIQGWLVPRLDAGTRRAVVEAQRRAHAEVVDQLGVADPAVQHALGVPGTSAATAMLAELDARLWSPSTEA